MLASWFCGRGSDCEGRADLDLVAGDINVRDVDSSGRDGAALEQERPGGDEGGEAHDGQGVDIQDEFRWEKSVLD